ncbi:hypothetical protein AAZX31_04G045000 [Glycine max]|uniref:ZCF37 n=1 Tax=Glycine soja TaxID=3848 RepID=A0A445KVN5_GLYSO|nr:uncharacterized protein LOC114408311 [Glycine soja]KAG5065334.1 hypothetical protein JHK86_009065 [Glycine max]KAH1252538.1 hypothetical protein GmHk_04G009480 [Glycine max]KHN04437.1 hypothetical protein glysoja_019524 [Glycine soja]RZC15015.1 hypothetical protein D0Y65_008767 [Glycine soja]
MLNNFICGSLHHPEEDVPCSSPKKSKRKESRNDKNPYSNRGLDKFSALLDDLDERRKKVYSQMSPQDISFVRFAYSNNHDIVPIVVKVKNNKDQKKHKSEELKARHITSFSEQLEKSDEEATLKERKQKLNKLESHKKNLSFSWNMLKRPSFYVPAVMMLILVFLVVFGRSVATLCTCVVWYVVPTLSEYYDSSKPRNKSMMNSKKRDYVRGWLNDSMKMMNPEELASPRTGDSKDYSNDKNSGKHGHQKSW